MTKPQLKEFLEKMSLAVLQAGSVAKYFQGKVRNEGKVAEILKGDTEALIAHRAAKTAVDEANQEILLLAASQLFKNGELLLDAEERTPSLKLFTKKDGGLSLVIDPLDGTFPYLSGKDGYSICLGLIENGKVIQSMVFFPARDEFYFLGEDRKAYLNRNSLANFLTKGHLLKAPKKVGNTIYANSRVPSEILEKSKEQGYKIISDINQDISWADALISCIRGEYKAALFETPQIRDVLLGAIIQGIEGGYALDFKGNELTWPQKGRVPEVVFGVGDPEEIKSIQ